MKRSAFCLIVIISIAGIVLFCLWRPEPGCAPTTFDGVHEGLTCLACSPDGHTFMTGGAYGDLQLWDVSKPSVLQRIATGHDGVMAVAYSADGSILASGGQEGTVKIWDTATLDNLITLPCGDSPVYGLTWSPDGRRLACASNDGTIRIWGSTVMPTLPKNADHLETGILAAEK